MVPIADIGAAISRAIAGSTSRTFDRMAAWLNFS